MHAALEVIMLVYVLLALAGVGYTVWVLRDALAEAEAVVRERINSVAQIETRGDVRQETGRLIGQCALVGVDLVLTVAVFTGRPSHRPVLTWAFVVLFAVLHLTILHNSRVAYTTRKQSLAVLRAQQKGEMT